MIEKVKKFMKAAGQETPEWPTHSTAEHRMSRIRMLMEEMLETAEAAGVDIYFDEDGGFLNMGSLIFYNKPENLDFTELNDGYLDILYITFGGIAELGIDPEPLFNAVHENNMTKFKDGYRDENGKWRKGPSFIPLDLKPLVDSQVAGEPPWVDYFVEPEPIKIPNGTYKDKAGNVHYFSSGPRDKMIWKLVDGRITKGVEKSKFYKYFSKV